MIASAKGAEINGICYNLNSQTKTAEVSSNANISSLIYSGDIVIPSTVAYEGETYNVTSIGDWAFDGCSGLTSVSIPNSVASIGEGAFRSCSSLTSITIPNSVVSVGNWAFRGCSGLTSVIIGNGVTSIGIYAFYNCSGLTSMTIPNSVTSIGDYAFHGCSGLVSVTIPNSVTSIGDYAFYDCNLRTIILPASVSSIGKGAFNCLDGNPQDVFCLSLTPPILADSYPFSSTAYSTIYVYNQAVDAYKSVDDWAKYKIFGLGSEDMDDFSQNGFHYGDGINNYLSCGITSISKAGSTIGSVSYVQKTFNLFLSNKHTDAITIKKVVAKDPSTDEELATLDDASKLGELKGGETKEFSITIRKDVDPVYEIYYTYNDRLSLLYTSASDKRQYDLTIQATGNGKVICEGKTAQSGSVSMKLDGGVAYTITITPDNGYCIESVTVNNTDVTSQVSNGQYTFTMTGNTDVSVKFKANKYKLTYMVDGNVYKTYDIEFGATITPEAAPAKEGYTFSGWSNIPTTMPANDVTVTGTFTVNKYKLIYKVDGVEYKTYDIEYGATITPEAAPTKEGYTFSGWNDLPQTMPAKDVTVNGTFTINKYKLTYMVDGSEYKSYDIEYGATITPEAAPTKEGYTFSGWSDIPTTMPANDVTVTGSFIVNKYTLTYMVDGVVYKTYDIEYGATITPEAAPTKEGYSFSGWNDLPQTMPAKDVTVNGTFTINKYKLTYMVDGSEYKSYDIEYGASITPEAAPTKEGYTFSGWSDIPTTMPAQDVTVTGTFTVNKYTLTYMVDGEVYKSYEIEYGATITPEAYPTKEGYSFSGWSDIPSTMPARDVTVTGSFSKGAYTLTYIVDGEVYKTVNYDYGATITPEAEPTKEGYTFSGWSYIPSTMPAENVTVTGSFTVNKYTLTYMVDGEVYKTYEIAYGSSITPEAEPTKEGYTFSGWSDIPQTMPARDVTVSGTFTKGAYKLIYMVDGEVYKTVSYDFGETITPEAEPTKEGYTFSGWSNIPTTMPANDVTVTGTFTVNKYKLIYMVDGEVYKSYDVEYGATITPEAEPMKEGYKFSGWSYIPSKMPAEDVTVVGTFTQEAEVKNKISYEIVGDNASVTHVDNAKGEIKIEESVEINGKTYQVTSIADGAFQGCTGLTSIELPNTITTIGKNAFDGCSGLIIIKIGKGIKEIGSKAFANIGKSKARTRAEDIVLKVYCEAEVLPSTAADAFENTPIDKATLYVVDGLVDVYKLVMPWNGFGTIVGLSTGINSVTIDSEDAMIFDMQGNRLDNIRKGVNIIRTRDGKTKKMMVK